jgi:hypothetical protein
VAQEQKWEAQAKGGGSALTPKDAPAAAPAHAPAPAAPALTPALAPAQLPASVPAPAPAPAAPGVAVGSPPSRRPLRLPPLDAMAVPALGGGGRARLSSAMFDVGPDGRGTATFEFDDFARGALGATQQSAGPAGSPSAAAADPGPASPGVAARKGSKNHKEGCRQRHKSSIRALGSIVALIAVTLLGTFVFTALEEEEDEVDNATYYAYMHRLQSTYNISEADLEVLANDWVGEPLAKNNDFGSTRWGHTNVDTSARRGGGEGGGLSPGPCRGCGWVGGGGGLTPVSELRRLSPAAAAVLFTFTIMSTIGYGKFAPTSVCALAACAQAAGGDARPRPAADRGTLVLDHLRLRRHPRYRVLHGAQDRASPNHGASQFEAGGGASLTVAFCDLERCLGPIAQGSRPPVSAAGPASVSARGSC